jgi:tetratricopeptide (TPR) repeat protein
MSKPRILPRNPYQTVSGPPSEVIGKSILRLLRSGSDLPVYRSVYLSHGMVKKLLGIIYHCNRVKGLADCLMKGPEIEWEFLEGFEMETDDLIDRVLVRLREDYPAMTGPLTEKLIERVNDAVSCEGMETFTRQFVKSEPETSADFQNRGNARDQEGDHEGAIQDYTRAIEMEPSEVIYRLARARCRYKHRGELELALIDVTGAVELCRIRRPLLDLDPHLLRAEIQAHLGYFEESISSLEEFAAVVADLIATAEWDDAGMGDFSNGSRVNGEWILDEVERGLEQAREIRHQLWGKALKMDQALQLEKTLKDLRGKF